MKAKEQIIEALEGKRTEAVWELIEKAVRKLCKDWITDIDILETKDRYLEYEDKVNDKTNRYILIEHYNFGDDFYSSFYEDGTKVWDMFEDYFSDTGDSTGWQEILCVDMKLKKCYLLDKETKYKKQEVEI